MSQQLMIITDGEWTSTIVDDQLYTNKAEFQDADYWARMGYEEKDYHKMFMTGSKALEFASCKDPNETWLPLLEKAYAKAHGDYGAIEGGYAGYVFLFSVIVVVDQTDHWLLARLSRI